MFVSLNKSLCLREGVKIENGEKQLIYFLKCFELNIKWRQNCELINYKTTFEFLFAKYLICFYKSYKFAVYAPPTYK